MIKVIYIDEDAGWQSLVHAALSDRYEIIIPETIPQNVSDIWDEVRDGQVAIVDFRLNENGIVAYTGDDVAREIHRHNKHFPIIIITSFEDNALQECTEIQTIRDKVIITSPNALQKLYLMIDSAVAIYDKKKAACEKTIQDCLVKISKGVALSPLEEADRFDAELYLSELDRDSSVRANLISVGTSKKLDEMLSLARTIVSKYKK